MRAGWLLPLCGLACCPLLQAETIVLPDVQVTLIENLRVPTREAGVVQQLLVRPGDTVVPGQLLLEMDDRLLRHQWQAAELQLAARQLESQDDVDVRYAETSRAVAEAEFDRLSRAVEAYDKSVSQSEMDQARLVSERSLLAAEQAQRERELRQLAVAETRKQSEQLALRLDWLRITAPAAGLIVEVWPQPGEWLPAGAPAVRLIRMDRLRVEGFVDGDQYDASLLGAPARLVVPLPPDAAPGEFTGRVTFVSPELNPVNGQIRIWADVDNPQLTLRPGTRGQLTIAQAPPASPTPQGSDGQP